MVYNSNNNILSVDKYEDCVGGRDMLNCNFNEKFIKEGLTFDDVLLIPAKLSLIHISEPTRR